MLIFQSVIITKDSVRIVDQEGHGDHTPWWLLILSATHLWSTKKAMASHSDHTVGGQLQWSTWKAIRYTDHVEGQSTCWSTRKAIRYAGHVYAWHQYSAVVSMCVLPSRSAVPVVWFTICSHTRISNPNPGLSIFMVPLQLVQPYRISDASTARISQVSSLSPKNHPSIPTKRI